MSNTLPYNRNDMYSIFEYSKKLLGHSLREVVGSEAIGSSKLQGKGKGGLEQMLEQLFFQYPINSDPGPDFKEAGLELKGTGLKRLVSGELQIKERLVCDMIDYNLVVNETFEDSLFYIKCRIMLIIFYLYEKDVSKWDLKFIFSVLWKLPEKDLLIIRHDFEVIVDKIRRGEAHLLSEGDTEYLGACRKGQKGDSPRRQPFSDIPAPKRAFALKPAYMRTILEYIKQQDKAAVSNITTKETALGAVTVDELRGNSFENIIIERFKPYYGLSYLEICQRLNVTPSLSKNRIAIVSNIIATEGNDELKTCNINDSEEFQKSGIRMKTVTSFSNGRVKEDTSFENIDYYEIVSNDNWYESRLYELFTSRFLFVVFQQPKNEFQRDLCLDHLQLKQVFFWTMPTKDIDIAEQYWEDIKMHVDNNEIDAKYFWNKAKHSKFHVRPKGRNAADLAPNPHGGMAKKYCYWFNSEYVTEIINQQKEMQ
ncbi:MAG: hypothetical protein IKN11_09730 [Bacteroidales bacterium]|nr:hypothetical protein [Bacteroidales bacterium]